MVYWIFGTNTLCPTKAVQNGIFSIIHAIDTPNCWQEALILYLVSEQELLTPNQFHTPPNFYAKFQPNRLTTTFGPWNTFSDCDTYMWSTMIQAINSM